MDKSTVTQKNLFGAAPKKENVWTKNLQWPVSMLLLLAAVLKSHQLSTSPYTGNLVLESRMLTCVIIAFEIFLAFWLISNFKPKFARLVAIATFSVFCVFGIQKVISGASSCGCFGVFEIPPIVTLVVDIGMIILLVLWPTTTGSGTMKFPATLAAVGAIVASASLWPVVTFTTSSLSDVGQVVGNGELIVVDTSIWVNKQLPIAGFISGEKNFLKGKWKMVLYHEDCPVCQRIIQEALAGQAETQTVFVEAPPYKSPPRADRESLLWRKLSDTHEWFVTAPDVIEITDGIVVRSLGQAK